jgi:hypothetical protein
MSFFRILTVIILQFWTTNLFSQLIYFSNHSPLFVGYNNELTVLPRSDSLKILKIVSDDANISKSSESRYFLNVKAAGEIRVNVYLQKSLTDTFIHQILLKVKNIPKPEISILEAKNMKLSYENLRKTNNLIYNFDLELKFSFLSFKVMHLRGDSLIKVFNCVADYFSAEFKEHILSNIKHGDKLIFFDINMNIQNSGANFFTNPFQVEIF